MSKDEFVRAVLKENLNLTTKRSRTSFEAKIIATNLPVNDRLRENEWFAKHCDEYDGKYVALDGYNLLAFGDSAKEVATKARGFGIKCPYIVYVEGSQHTRFISVTSNALIIAP